MQCCVMAMMHHLLPQKASLLGLPQAHCLGTVKCDSAAVQTTGHMAVPKVCHFALFHGNTEGIQVIVILAVTLSY